MAIEPVNERPIFPSVTRSDTIGLGNWSVSMVRQLTTVFQQYGYRLNNALLNEDLAAEDGTVAEIDEAQTWTATQTFTPAQIFSHTPNATGNPLRWDDLAANGGSIGEVDESNTWVPAQVFQATPTATGHPLRWDELAGNGGTIPETDRANTFGPVQEFTAMPTVGGDAVVARGSNTNGHWTRFADGTQICRVSGFQLPGDDTDLASAVWTYPQSFVNTDIIVSVNMLSASSSSYFRNLGCFRVNPSNITDADVQAWLDDSVTVASGDVINVDVIAIGSWK